MGDGDDDGGPVCCDPSCPDGFGACEAGGRRFCATSRPLLGADACAVLSRLGAMLSPDAACGADAAPAPLLGAGAAAPGGNAFSPRAVVSAVAGSSADPDGVEAAVADDPRLSFVGIASLPDETFADGGEAATAAKGGAAGAAGARSAGGGDPGASSLLAAALERQYEVTTNAPPPPMTVQEVLSMDPWAADFKDVAAGAGSGGNGSSSSRSSSKPPA